MAVEGIVALASMQALGSLTQAFSMREQGKMAQIQLEERRAAAMFMAWQAEQQAAVAVAIGQRNAIEESRKARLMDSRALAVLAAGGGSASDPTSMRLMAEYAAQGAYRKSVALYEGEATARKLKTDAVLGRTAPMEDGRAAGYEMAAAGALIKGGATLFARYGMGGPGGGPAGGGPSGDTNLIGDFNDVTPRA